MFENNSTKREVKTYQATDTQLVKGQAYCIYNYMLRGITDPMGTSKMLELVENITNLTDARLVAANYLFRDNYNS